MSDSLWLHGPQHPRPPCPSPSPGVCPSLCPRHHWCHLAISSSDALFFCPQSFPESGRNWLRHRDAGDHIPATSSLGTAWPLPVQVALSLKKCVPFLTVSTVGILPSHCTLLLSDWLHPGGSEGFPGGSDGRICLQCGRPGFDPWVWNIPWRREQQPTPVFLPGESHGQRSLVGYIQSMGLQRVGQGVWPLPCAAVQDSQHFLTRGGPSPTLAEHPGSHGPSFWVWPLVPLLLWVTLDTFGLRVWYLWTWSARWAVFLAWNSCYRAYSSTKLASISCRRFLLSLQAVKFLFLPPSPSTDAQELFYYHCNEI